MIKILKNDIVNGFFKKFFDKFDKDSHSKNPSRVFEYYIKSEKINVIKNSAGILFKKKYNFKSNITNEDFDFALNILHECLMIKDLKKISR